MSSSITKETASVEQPADSAANSAAAKVFNTYELAEMIIVELSHTGKALPDLARCMRICNTTRRILSSSKAIESAVYWKKREQRKGHPSDFLKNYVYSARLYSSACEVHSWVRFHFAEGLPPGIQSSVLKGVLNVRRDRVARIRVFGITREDPPGSGLDIMIRQKPKSAEGLWRMLEVIKGERLLVQLFSRICGDYFRVEMGAGATFGQVYDWVLEKAAEAASRKVAKS